MNKLTELLRYLLPGGFFLFYSFLFSSLFGFEWSATIKSLKDIEPLSSVIVVLLPCIGYFSSSIHHLIYNCEWLPCYRINLYEEDENQNKSYNEKWTRFNIEWRKYCKNDFYEVFDKRNDSLTDLMHGNGAILVSLVLSIIGLGLGACFCNHQFDPNWKDLTYVFIFIVVLSIHIRSYYVTKKHAENFVKIALREMKLKEIEIHKENQIKKLVAKMNRNK